MFANGGARRSAKKVIQRLSDVAGTLEVGEVPATPERDEKGCRNCSGNVSGDFCGKEVVIAGDDERRNLQSPESGEEVVSFRLPGVAHEPVLHRAGLEDAFPSLVDVQRGRRLGLTRYFEPVLGVP